MRTCDICGKQLTFDANEGSVSVLNTPLGDILNAEHFCIICWAGLAAHLRAAAFRYQQELEPLEKDHPTTAFYPTGKTGTKHHKTPPRLQGDYAPLPPYPGCAHDPLP